MTPIMAFLSAAAIIGLIVGLNMYELRASRFRKVTHLPEPFVAPQHAPTQRYA